VQRQPLKGRIIPEEIEFCMSCDFWSVLVVDTRLVTSAEAADRLDLSLNLRCLNVM
jgi:hypothetical protein